ncbi:uncharacterized protein HD556DRAFT_1482054 [Suillus plorans]|uniref:Uncharacterized protein n=1 Tax=Suillus plorans TaxID=116603 RepID=A0A9P7DH01_9AGAM|nr:uncharacterized protein HD556DRAFT_1482054 [Suillus plorans]KAG1792347.1 hypothetical protein HD556DRAFT_1482054 [Suillus plorans]
MAQITLTDGSCMPNGCRYPLARSSHLQSFVRAHQHLPWAWILARHTLLDVNCSIVPSDQSHLFEGHVSIRHILNSSPRLASSFLNAALPALTRHGFTQLSHFGSWAAQNTASPRRFEPSRNWMAELSTTAPSLRRHLPSLISWLEHLYLGMLLDSSCDETLAIARPLIVIATYRSHEPSQQRPFAASDASMLPLPASLFQARSVTSAAATPNSQVVFSLASYGTSAGILHGELLGIIAAVLLSIHANPQEPYSVLADHKNAVHMIHEVLPGALPHVWNNQPARSLYRWLFSLLHSPTPAPSLVWTAGHTNGLAPECLTNDYVDRMTSYVQERRGVIPSAPLATFSMDDYAMFASGYGFVENNLSSLLISRLEDSYALSDSFRPARALTLALYDSHRLPDLPYTRASSSFSAIVQLYAWSSQLDTAEVPHRRFRDTPALVSFWL